MLTRKRVAVTGVLLLALCLAHYVWFSWFGPPSWWGSGTAVAVPVFAAHGPRDFTRYLPSLAAPGGAKVSDPVVSNSTGDLLGTPFRQDSASECGLSVVQTHAGRLWGDDQHLYFRRTDGDDWHELELTRANAFDATVVCPEAHAYVLLSRWNSWWPYKSEYGRFLLSILVRELRAEFGVYALDIERADLKYLFPGAGLMASPDRRWVAYLTSANAFSGFHNIMVFDAQQGRSSRVLSLLEADPGSGRSFTYIWSLDSSALMITGTASGFTPNPITRIPLQLQLVYLVGTGELVNLEAQMAGPAPTPPAG